VRRLKMGVVPPMIMLRNYGEQSGVLRDQGLCNNFFGRHATTYCQQGEFKQKGYYRRLLMPNMRKRN
jgi:hypothetical protein